MSKDRNVEEVALDWLIEVKMADDLEKLWPKFRAWLKSPDHYAAYLRVEEAWRSLESLKRLRPGDEVAKGNRLPKGPRNNSRRRSTRKRRQ